MASIYDIYGTRDTSPLARRIAGGNYADSQMYDLSLYAKAAQKNRALTQPTSTQKSASQIVYAPQTPVAPSYNPETATYDQVAQRLMEYRAANPATPGNTYFEGDLNVPGLTEEDEALQTGADYYGGIANEDVDENRINRDVLRMYQKEIDATNEIYRQQMNQARLVGEGRLGSTRAIGARSGVLGSDFGAAQKQKVVDYNTDIYRSIDAEKAAAIGAIEGTARRDAAAQIAEKRAAKEAGVEKWLEYLGKQGERKISRQQAFIKDLIAKGVSPEEINPEKLAEYASQLGTSADELSYMYKDVLAENEAATREEDLKTRKTEAEIAKIEADIAAGKVIKIGEGDMLMNIETGETFKNPKTYKPDSTDGGAAGEVSPYQLERARRTLENVSELKTLAEENPGIFGRSAAVPLPLSMRTAEYRNYNAKLDTLKSNIAFGELTAMREASKTGGALGQVSDREGRLLESSLGALAMYQKPEDILAELQKIEDSINRWLRAVGESGYTPEDFGGGSGSAAVGTSGKTSSGISYTVIED